MNTYLLLRNNTETGPYTLEDLLSKGLKAYDLVWVKDRSAAWRYPSEIEELKTWAPAVEEQPFDRFYKRPAEQVDAPTPALELAREADLARQADLDEKARQEQWAEQALRAQRARQALHEQELQQQKSSDEIKLREQKARLAAKTAEALRLQEMALAEQAAEAARVLREQQAARQADAQRALEELEQKLQLQAAELARRERQVIQPVPVDNTRTGQVKPVLAEIAPTPAPVRKVFVTMPGGNRPVAKPAPVAAVTEAAAAMPQQATAATTTSPLPTAAINPRQPEQETISMSVNERAASLKNPAPSSDLEKQMASYGNPGGNGNGGNKPPVNNSTTPDATIRFSQPLDEIKERYVQTLQERRTKTATDDRWKKMARNAAVVVGLIGVGLLAGFMMRNTAAIEKPVAVNSPRPVVEIPASVEQEAAMQETGTVDAGSANEVPVEEKRENVVAVTNPQATPGVSHAAVREPSAPAATTAEKQKEKSEAGRRQVLFDENKFARNNSITNPATGERSKTTRDERSSAGEVVKPAPEAAPKASVKNDWGSQVTVASNDYKKVAFGGIRNLQLTVTNHGKKAIDQVVVELTYLKPSEEPLRTEQVNFKKIEAGSSSTVRIADTNRGIRVTYKIIQVTGSGSESVAGN
ncbi:MAG: hypothetical protein EOO09_12825 [Chitinophagaceae bacterium]|nr:MAG: hypothetical protein EOO09_12825 [Chitinophagaceae bacterium]